MGIQAMERALAISVIFSLFLNIPCWIAVLSETRINSNRFSNRCITAVGIE